MEILKDKKFIIGGLAVVGVIALISYFRKPKINSEGFFSANGNRSLETAPISEISLPMENNIPTTFTRKVFTNGGMKSYCGRYDMIAGKKGFVYRLQLDLISAFANAGALSTVTFANGNFYNSNGTIIGTNNPPTIISNLDYKKAWLNGQPCN
jgi:hypothetical protein